MAYIFGDSFDLYASPPDALVGYWDSGATGNIYLTPGRFTGQAWRNGGVTGVLTKSSGANDSVHHLNVAFRNTSPLAGTFALTYIQLIDGTTNQCCIVFRSDGAVLLTSGGPTGTTLATYITAVMAPNVWFTFEFEVVVHGTAGSFKVRKNGSPTDDHSTTGINTRTSANNYANKITIATQNFPANYNDIDDFLWRSDASSVPWLGDVRCYTRMPASDASTQFSRSLSSANNYIYWPGGSWNNGPSANTVWAEAITPTYTGNATAIIVNLAANVTGNVNMALYAMSGTLPGALLGACTALTNPLAGIVTFTLTASVPVTKGVPLFIAMLSNAATSVPGQNVGLPIYVLAQTYASGFPASMAGYTSASTQLGFANLGITIATTVNSQMVSETIQDSTTTYVYDAVVGHADFYNHDQIAAVGTVVALTARGLMVKSDAGTRSGAIQLKSGASTVAAPTLPLSTNFLWSFRTDTLNPATGTAWTTATANAAQSGPVVVS